MAVPSVVLLGFLFSVRVIPLASAQSTYHIRPSTDSPCPDMYKDCLTLSEYGNRTSDSDNLTLEFLPGEHVLNNSIIFQQREGLSLLGDYTILPDITSKIVCKEGSTFTFMNIFEVEIKALMFSSLDSINITHQVLNTTEFPTIFVLLIQNFHLVSCHLEQNQPALQIESSNAYFKDCSFVNNSGRFGGALAMYDSTLELLGQNYFLDNDAIVNVDGGGIYVADSKILFEGSTSFVNITCGDISSGMRISSTVRFVHNFASDSGGGLSLSDSRMFQGGGFLIFIGNTASGDGGGISSYLSAIRLDGTALFEGNSAAGRGGAVVAWVHSTWNSTVTEFVGNSAQEGGAVCLSHFSSMNFEHDSAFEQNLGIYGAGILVSDSTVSFQGNTMFGNNSGGEGGGVWSSAAKMYFEGNTVFIGNSAKYGGGLFAKDRSILELTGKSWFLSNTASSQGGGLHLSSSIFVLSGSSTHSDNTAGEFGGGVCCTDESEIALEGDITMTRNSATVSGGAVAVMNYSSINIDGGATFTQNWASYSGGALYGEDSQLHLGGENSFSSNAVKLSTSAAVGYGGAIHAVKTFVTFTGLHNFSNNSARDGGGLAITGAAFEYSEFFLQLSSNALVSFLDNHGEKRGGAIFVGDIRDQYCGPNLNVLGRVCFITISDYTHSSPPLVELPHNLYDSIHKCIGHIVFEGNFAEEHGNLIYGGSLHNCRVELQRPYEYDSCNNGTCYMSGLEALAALTRKSVEQLTGDPLDVVSATYTACICDMEKLNCKSRSINYTAYPGENIDVPVVAVMEDAKVPAIFQASVNESQGVWLGQLQETQPAGLSCSPLGYTLFTSGKKSVKLALTAEGPCKNPGIPIFIYVNFLSCPPGFALSQFGSCGCERRLGKYTNTCDINNRKITRNSNFWVGYDGHSHGLVLHPHCPFDYCKVETVAFPLNSTDLQCAYGRSGMLCGACKSGLSLNLGSSQCSNCSNVFLLLFLPFVIAGLLLVIFLFTCEVTVAAGKISGLFFYANVLAVNRNVFFPSSETSILTVFIAWLNLDLGIETCFIDGMDVYTRTWLQFVFPIYVWMLVGLITIVSRHSMRFARFIGPTNPISVLATLFLLSYTKLLRTIIATFSFTTLDYPNNRRVTVWVYDGNIGYFEGKHIPLFLTGLLAFVFLFLPYTVFLLFGQCIEEGSNHRLLSWVNNPKVRSFLDAYHAPYKNRYRYWTGLLLIVRFVLFIISAVVDINSPRDPSINLLVLGITCTILTIWVWNTGGIYWNRYNNALESSFILNLAVLALASYQVRVEGGNQAAVIYTSVSIAFVTFLGITTYHLKKHIKESRTWRIAVRPMLQHFKDRVASSKQCQDDPVEMAVPPTAPPAPVTTTVVELREPLDLLEV